MDRPIVYAGQVPRALDNLNLGEFTMVGLSKLAEALLGTGTIVSQGGFAVTPGNGLNIAVGPGQIYQLESIETQALSALAANGTQILKQGVALNAQTETLALTAAAGQAQNFLVEVAYADISDGSVVLSFQNPTPVQDPATGALKYVTYPGPGGSGAASFTILRGGVSVVVKPGTPAQAGQQVSPAPDAGYVGLYVVTLGYGATSVTSGNITPYAAAPFIPATLPAVPAGVQSGKWRSGIDTGTASNLVVALNPQPAALTPLMEIIVPAAAVPTGATVANVAGFGNLPVVRRGNLPVAAGDWNAGDLLALRLNVAGSAWMLGGVVPSDILGLIQAGLGTFAAASGTNTYVAALTPAPSALPIGTRVDILFGNANTSAAAPTLNLNGLGAKPILKQAGGVPVAGDVSGILPLVLLNGGWTIEVPVPSDTATAITNSPAAIPAQTYLNPGTFQVTVPAGATKCDSQIWGGGGGSGGVGSTGNGSSSGGGSGSYSRKAIAGLTAGQQITLVIGAQGAAGGGGGYGGSGGTTSFGNYHSAPGGGGGSPNGVGTGGAGGATPTGGDINIPGAAGTAGAISGNAFGGPGGAAPFGSGGGGSGVGAGGPGPSPGGGGGGSGSSPTNPGALGGAGVAILKWS